MNAPIIFLILLWVAVVVLASIAVRTTAGAERRQSSLTDTARVALHRSRRRLDGFVLRSQIKADAALLRRELERDLSGGGNGR